MSSSLDLDCLGKSPVTFSRGMAAWQANDPRGDSIRSAVSPYKADSNPALAADWPLSLKSLVCETRTISFAAKECCELGPT